jgi:hypothetical protein
MTVSLNMSQLGNSISEKLPAIILRIVLTMDCCVLLKIVPIGRSESSKQSRIMQGAAS